MQNIFLLDSVIPIEAKGQSLQTCSESVYFKEKDRKIILLLIGGDKSTQQRDIEKAKEIWSKIKK